MNPKISVILLSYNQEKYLENCLAAFEKQTFRNFELVVIDDGSSDNSSKILKRWSSSSPIPHKLIFNTLNIGICPTINKALTYTKGIFVSIMACDDWPDPDYLERMIDAISLTGENTAFVFAKTREVNEEGVVTSPGEIENRVQEILYEPPALFDELLRNNIIQAPAVLIRKAAFLRIGDYDESLYFEDYDMWLRLSSSFSALHINQVLVNYRIVQSSMSRNPDSLLARKKSEIQILLKWTSNSKSNDKVIANRIRSISIEMLSAGQISATRNYIRVANRISFDLRWVLFRESLNLKLFADLAQKSLNKINNQKPAL